ncbi:hypothetical protein D3C72_1813460 [compost metagenome]
MRLGRQDVAALPVAEAVVGKGQRHGHDRANRETPPDRLGADMRLQQPCERQPDPPHRHEQDNQGRHDRTGGAHRAKHNNREAEQDERPQHHAVDMLGDANRRAVLAKKNAERMPVEQVDQRHQRPGHHHIEQQAHARNAGDARPQAGAHILRDHRRHAGANGQGRHLHVSP